MKIKTIKVHKLFGVFDHEINLNNDVKITIVIGENGLGKTILLEMIDAFFKNKLYYFRNVEFEKISFEFDDQISWELSKVEIGSGMFQVHERAVAATLSLTQVNKNGTKYNPITFATYSPADSTVLAHNTARRIPFLTRISAREWEDRRTGERLQSEEVIERFPDYLPVQTLINNEEYPKWFISRHKQIKVSLIETQRLISIEGRKDERHNTKQIEKYSKELRDKIKSYLTESTELSSKLDRTYPNRLIDRIKNSSNINIDQLNQELNKLERKRKTLDAVGLIEIEKESNILEIENPGEVVRDVLMLYVEDSFKKIEIFDDLAAKIDILLQIINKRFKHKKLLIDKEEGFSLISTIIKDKKGAYQKINPTKLSSGEQNELVLFYLLLFKTEPSSLILIDEPEVSLHISWQNSFIEDLKQIAKLNNLDVVIATHSPDIISNNWDLKVELRGLE